MAGRARVVLLAPESPYPAVGGGPLRTAALIEFLAKRAELDVVVFCEPGAADSGAGRLAEVAPRVLRIKLPFHARTAWARARRNLLRYARGVPPLVDRFGGFEDRIREWLAGNSYELAIVEHFWCAPYGRVLDGHAKRLVLDLHNVESVLHERCARVEGWPLSAIHRRFATASRRLERRWLPAYSQLLVPSQVDAERVYEIVPGAQVYVYPNTIPLVPAPERREREAIAFTANMEYAPNMAAVRYFAREVWPRLRARRRDLEWWLVGRRPEAIRRYVASLEGVRVFGAVEDAVSLLAQAKAAVVPVEAGSGTRVKILEAWAAATPVVSTTVGAEGLAGRAGEHLLIADSVGEFVDAVLALLDSAALREKLGAAGRALYERSYTWEAGWGRLAANPVFAGL